MYKTKLGISVGLLGAFICFLGLFFDVTNWFFVALLGLVLWLEDNAWLRKLMVKVAIISLILLLIPYVTDLVISIFEFFDGYNIDETLAQTYIGSYSDYVLFTNHVHFYLDKIILVLRTVVFIILGVKSLNQGHFSMKRIDKLIDKNV